MLPSSNMSANNEKNAEMIARDAKGREKDQTEELRALVFRLKDVWRVALTHDGPATV